MWQAVDLHITGCSRRWQIAGFQTLTQCLIVYRRVSCPCGPLSPCGSHREGVSIVLPLVVLATASHSTVCVPRPLACVLKQSVTSKVLLCCAVAAPTPLTGSRGTLWCQCWASWGESLLLPRQQLQDQQQLRMSAVGRISCAPAASEVCPVERGAADGGQNCSWEPKDSGHPAGSWPHLHDASSSSSALEAELQTDWQLKVSLSTIL